MLWVISPWPFCPSAWDKLDRWGSLCAQLKNGWKTIKIIFKTMHVMMFYCWYIVIVSSFNQCIKRPSCGREACHSIHIVRLENLWNLSTSFSNWIRWIFLKGESKFFQVLKLPWKFFLLNLAVLVSCTFWQATFWVRWHRVLAPSAGGVRDTRWRVVVLRYMFSLRWIHI